MSLTVTNLSKTFDNRHEIFQDLSFHLESGQVLIVEGPSGSGKTTLFHCIIGLLNPTNGKILLDGKSIRNFEVKKRNIGIMMQHQPLYENMTVVKNLKMAIHCKDDKSINNILKRCLLEKLKNESVAKLSGGERRRVAFARSIINRPKVLLLDEPFISLDKSAIEKLIQCIVHIRNEKECAIVIATHRSDLLQEINPKILCLKK